MQYHGIPWEHHFFSTFFLDQFRSLIAKVYKTSKMCVFSFVLQSV